MMIMGRRCEDCGNQAKKECLYMRCRTCCKSKAFHCQTHIKSTWVPTYRRSHRLQPQLQSQTQTQTQLLSTTNPKRLRQLPPPSNASPTSSGVQVHTTPGHFPEELTSTAIFRCVKVSSLEDGKEQYAYQTTMNIGGHVFKGILHDQGLEKVMLDHNYNTNYHQSLVSPSTSSTCPLMITSPFTDFMSCTQYSSHQKPN